MEQMISLTRADIGVLPPVRRRQRTGSSSQPTAPAAQPVQP